MNSKISANLLQHLHDIADAEGFIDYTVTQEAASGSKHHETFITITGTRKASEENGNDNDDSHNSTTYDNEDTLPNSLELLCKVQPTNKADTVCNDHEVFCYTSILPVFEHFQREKGLHEDNGFFGFPRCYLATSDPSANQSIIIMDNLRALGYDDVWPNESVLIDFERVQLLMEQMGRLHGLSFVLRDQRPDELDVFGRIDNVWAKMFETKAMRSALESCYERAENLLNTATDKEHIRKYRRNWTDVLRRCCVRSATTVDPFAVLGHGDCWLKNTMYANDGNGDPAKMCLLNWQIGYFGSPALDLSYYLMSSTTKALRDRHYEQFIRIYYKNLSDIIRACGSDPDKLFTFADMQSQLIEFGVYGVILAPMLLTMIVSNPKSIVSINELVEVMADGDDTSNQFMVLMDETSEAAFRQRLSDVIADAKAYGWI